MTRINSLCGARTSPVPLCMQNCVISTRIISLCGSRTSTVILCMQNSAISTRITSLHGSQTSPVVLCMQNNEISIRNTSLYGSQPSSPVFANKTATFGPELKVYMCPRLRLLNCACKTTWLASEILVSMGGSPHLLFLQAKQRLLDQKYECLCVPDFACWFLKAKQRD